MNLVKFLLFAAIASIILGEFGRYPFGASGNSVSLLDILVGASDLFFIIWMVIGKSQIKVPKQFFFIIAFWLFGFASLLFSLTLFPINQVLTGSLYLWRFIIYSFVLLLVFNLIRYQVFTKQQMIDWLINVGITVALLGFAQLILLPNFDSSIFSLTDFGFDPHQGRLTSTFLDPNFVGAYLVLTGGLIIYQLLSKKLELTWWILILLDFVALILTYSRSAYLMLASFGLTFLLISWKDLTLKTKYIQLAIILLVIVLAMIIFPRFYSRLLGGVLIDKSAAERVGSWQDGLAIFKMDPLIGIGFDNIRTAKENLNFFKAYSPDGGHSGAGIDSSLLFVLASTGVIGFVTYLGFWISTIRELGLKKNVFSKIVISLLIGLLVESQFINSLFFPAIMLTYWLVVGLGLGVD